MTSGREYIKNSLVALLGILIALVFSEIWVRIFDVAPQVGATSHERYRLSPNVMIGIEPVENFQIGVDRSNALGYRGPLYALQKSPLVFRVVVLGDSVSEGLLIPDYKDVYSAVLESELNGSGLAAEVMNFGVNGYNTSQEVQTFRDKGLKFSPDLVLLQYSLNDNTGDDGGLAGELIKKARGQAFIEGVWDHPFLLNSALYRFIKYRVLRYSTDAHWMKANAALEQIGKDRVREEFAELRKMTGHSCVLVAIFPWFEKGLTPYPYQDQHVRVASFAEENGFMVIDMLDVFRKCEVESGAKANIDHVHPNVTGHRCAGQALASYLRESDLIASCSSVVGKLGNY